MLIFDPDATDPHQPNGVQSCALCSRCFYTYPAPQSTLCWLFCHACLTGDCPAPRTGPERVRTLRQAIWHAVNRLVWYG